MLFYFGTQFPIWTHIYSQLGVKTGPKLLLCGRLFHESREICDFFNFRGGPYGHLGPSCIGKRS